MCVRPFGMSFTTYFTYRSEAAQNAHFASALFKIEIPYNPLVRYTSLLSVYSAVQYIVLLHITHPSLSEWAF